ncbi:hypothetical protein GIY23_08315 [Allosaccharopolyspora coralli]|uniref:Uncharacterized protein n=1 Tax=Allosaccharopolyspora coralli TaxID=2665642 RepID=A0A5Q3Q7W2_9PSEU|nr:hypothetical protein [Allosaccharopolyspora coralli]QGK69526.1 hypothetical protein GIY23_08315 [Allosaccharopolyspora coralli]
MTTGPTGRLAPTERAAFRAYVRAHHPDVGGDPQAFATGLARWREGANPARWSTVDRYDGPVVFVDRPSGVRGLVHDVRERLARRKQPPRVR